MRGKDREYIVIQEKTGLVATLRPVKGHELVRVLSDLGHLGALRVASLTTALRSCEVNETIGTVQKLNSMRREVR